VNKLTNLKNLMDEPVRISQRVSGDAIRVRYYVKFDDIIRFRSTQTPLSIGYVEVVAPEVLSGTAEEIANDLHFILREALEEAGVIERNDFYYYKLSDEGEKRTGLTEEELSARNARWSRLTA
jgi:hypothetical protein